MGWRRPGSQDGPGGWSSVPAPLRPSHRCPRGPRSVSLSEAVQPQLGATQPTLGLLSAQVCQVSGIVMETELAAFLWPCSLALSMELPRLEHPSWPPSFKKGPLREPRGSFHLDMSRQKASLWGSSLNPGVRRSEGPRGILLCLNAGFHPQGHHRGLRGTGGSGGPTARRVGWHRGGPLTQQQLPRGLLGWLPASGPEVALGVSDLEARLLPDAGGGGTWGKPTPSGGLSRGQGGGGGRARQGRPEGEGARRGATSTGSWGVASAA